jgi:hypothetical protein
MTTDDAFDKADLLLQKATNIWKEKNKKQYAYAERCYQEAIRIRDEYFSDNKKVLTEEPNPF